jgi:hypothetical protein
LGDVRPFDGPWATPLDRSSQARVSRVKSMLNVTIDSANATSSAPWNHPGDVFTYQIYPGGKIYYAKTLPATLANTRLGPDVRTNPLGVFVRQGAVRLQDNVSIQGSIILSGSSVGPDLIIDGSDIRLAAVEIPGLDGEAQTFQLPTAIVRDDFIVTGNARSCAVRGMVLAWDDFAFVRGTDQSEFFLEGRVFADELRLQPRSQWSQSGTWWEEKIGAFLAQADEPEGIEFLPVWLEEYAGFAPRAKLTLRPPSDSATYHWHNWSRPLFTPLATDAGLVWDLVHWQDNPQNDSWTSPAPVDQLPPLAETQVH